MRTLGIDPGTKLLGWAVLDAPRTRVASGVVRCRVRVPRKCTGCGAVVPRTRCSECGRWHQPLTLRRLTRAGGLATVERETKRLVDEYKPDLIALEHAYVGAYATAVIGVSEARGVVIGVAAAKGVRVESVEASVHKKCLTDKGNATKGQVRAAVWQLYEHEVEADDESDAISIAHWGAVTKGPQ